MNVSSKFDICYKRPMLSVVGCCLATNGFTGYGRGVDVHRVYYRLMMKGGHGPTKLRVAMYSDH